MLLTESQRLQLTLPAVAQARIKRNTLILIGIMFYCYLSNFFFTQFSNKIEHHPFPFHGVNRNGSMVTQDISHAAYADYAAKAISWAIFLFILCSIMPEYREVLFIGSFLFFGYAVEFAMIYNDPIRWWHDPFFDVAIIPIGFSTFAGLVLLVMFFTKYFEKW